MNIPQLGNQYRAAAVFAPMVARGALSILECTDALAAAGAEAAPLRDHCGIRVHLAHYLRDLVASERQRIDQVVQRLERDLRQLAKARAPGSDIMAAGGKANAAFGHPLSSDELLEAARHVVFGVMKTERGRHHARG